ncbi:ATP-binding cassette domain-containing protein [Alphaproteobacteria bacterium]|nr:ATP-binding cassette domain-containing protein [Alphaproteobacteria bacterium]
MTDARSNDDAHSGAELPPLHPLALLLSQLSMARGNGASLRRVLDALERTELQSVEQITRKRLRKVWRELFPKSQVEERQLSALKDGDYPCLLIDRETWEVYLCKGQSPGGALLQDSKGQSNVRDPETLNSQVFTFQQFKRRASQKPLTASDLFRLAMRSHRRLLNEALLASLVAAILGIGSALFTMQVYDRVIPTGYYSTLIVLSVGVGLAILLEFFSKQIKTSFVDRATESTDLGLSQLFFERGIDLSLATRPKTVGTLAAQIKNFELVRQFMVTSLFFLWADLPVAIFFLGVIWMIGGQIALVPLALLPLGVFVGLLLRGPIEKNTKLNIEESNKKSGLLIEALEGIETVKASGARSFFTQRWKTLSEAVVVGEFRVKRLSALATNVSQTLQQFSYIGMVTFGAILVTQGELTMGSLIACTILSGRALAPLSQFPHMLAQAKKSKIAVEALNGIMALPAERDVNQGKVVPDRCMARLETDAVSFGYDQSPAVSFPALRFNSGQKMAILGAVGSGKSTLLKILAGLYAPNEGRVRLDDYDLQILAEDFVREQISYLPQDVKLFSGTLRDNLTLGLPMVKESELNQACHLTGLSRVIAGHPMGLNLTIFEGGQGLSTGQRQLVGITRLLLAKPKIILLDEPTSALDQLLERHLLEVIFEQLSSATIIMVTHKMGHIEFVERVAVVDKGRMVMDGPKADVMARLNAISDNEDTK